MKKFFLSIIALMTAIATYAQSTLVATLTHDDNITMFYGVFALQQAHTAATDGDIINLSGGSFASVKVTKALTIRGTGVLDAMPTAIIGDFEIEIPTTATDRLAFEGCIISNTITVKGTLSNAYFLKDNINDITIYNYGNSIYGEMVNGTFINCNVYKFLLQGSSTAQFVNCYVSDFLNSSPTASATFMNCVVRPTIGYMASNLNLVQLINSILWNDHNTAVFNRIPSTSSAYNCVAVGNGNAYVFNSLSVKQNCKAVGIDIFVDGNVGKDLTDEAKAEYLGTDGTPVGMYGGIMPWSQVPTYPQITKMNVANKTTADGKLSVEIEVSAVQ